jgi:2-hydroxychromene-2-carboxylate isomerase
VSAAIGLYTDFLSPYGCLGAIGLVDVAARHSREIDWRPILLGVTVMRVMGLPAVPDTPLKGDYLRHDAPRSFRYAGVPYNPPQGKGQLAPLPAARAITWVKERTPERTVDFGLALYRAHFCEGRDVGTADGVARVAAEVGLDRDAALAAMADEAIKARLREHVELAVARGVFGAPTFEVDGELFWGHDRLPQVERWLESGGW